MDVVAFARALLSHTTRLFTGGHAGVPLENLRVRPLKKSGNIFRVGIFLKEGSLGSPHVLRAHMGYTRGEPNEIDLCLHHGNHGTMATAVAMTMPMRTTTCPPPCDDGRQQQRQRQQQHFAATSDAVQASAPPACLNVCGAQKTNTSSPCWTDCFYKVGACPLCTHCSRPEPHAHVGVCVCVCVFALQISFRPCLWVMIAGCSRRT